MSSRCGKKSALAKREKMPNLLMHLKIHHLKQYEGALAYRPAHSISTVLSEHISTQIHSGTLSTKVNLRADRNTGEVLAKYRNSYLYRDIL